MNIFEAAVIALCAVILSAVLKKTSAEQGILLSIAAVMLIMLPVMGNISPFVNQIEAMVSGGNSKYIAVLLKAVGISVVGQVTESICRDCGESALAYGVSIASKAAVLLLSLPIITEIFEYLAVILGRG